MKRDIFYLLNQVETDLGEYEISGLTQDEIKESTERILCKLENAVSITAAGAAKRRKLIKAAAILAACLLSAGGIAYAMTDGQVFDYVFISGGGIYEETNYHIWGEESTTKVVMGNPDAENAQSGVPLLFEEGRLYFTGDGGKTDITDEISETEPCIFNITDEAGNTHKFIIGGRAEEDYYGYMEEIIDSEGCSRGAVGSYGSKVGMSAGNEPEWLRKGR